MENAGEVRSWYGRDLIDRDGQVIGRIAEAFLDDETREPKWAVVEASERTEEPAFVPLTGAVVEAQGVRVPVARTRALSSPPVRVVKGRISPEQENILLGHYAAAAPMRPAPERGHVGGRVDAGTVDDLPSVVRSEEELSVEKKLVPRERVRLVKRVVTETVTKTFEVRREELHIEREPLDDVRSRPAQAPPAKVPGTESPAGEDEAGGGRLATLTGRLPEPVRARIASLPRAALGARVRLAGHRGVFEDEVTDILLRQEEVVILKRVVPRERVRLRKETVIEQRQVTDDLRREHVDLERRGEPRE